MKTRLTLLCALFISTNFLFAQDQEEIIQQLFYTIHVESADKSKKTKMKLKDQDAIHFDVLSFLNEQDAKAKIRITGRKKSNQEYILYSFNSEDLDQDAECTGFCQKIESIERTPFLGVSVLPMDDFSGVRVTKIFEISHLVNSNLQENDVITAIGDYEITDPCDLVNAIAEYPINHSVDLHFTRNEITYETNTTIGYRIKKKISWEYCCPPEVALTTPSSLKEMKLAVYPNPTFGVAELEFHTSSNVVAELIISDFNGQLIKKEMIYPANNYWKDYLDLSDYPSGIYTIQLKQAEELITKRVVVVE